MKVIRSSLRRKTQSSKPTATLQEAKLALEIAELQRSTWTKPAVILPVAGTIITLAISQYLGVFEVERKRIEIAYKESLIAKKEVESQIQALSEEKLKLDAERKLLSNTRDVLDKQVESLKAEVGDLRRRELSAAQKANDATKRAFEIESKLSVPDLAIGYNFEPTSSIAELRVVNRGLGPAKISSILYFVNNGLVKSESVASELAKAMDILDLDERWVKTENRTSAVAPGEIVKLVQVLPDEFTETRSRQLQLGLRHFSVEICYCSTLGRCKWTAFQRTVPKSQCTERKG